MLYHIFASVPTVFTEYCVQHIEMIRTLYDCPTFAMCPVKVGLDIKDIKMTRNLHEYISPVCDLWSQFVDLNVLLVPKLLGHSTALHLVLNATEDKFWVHDPMHPLVQTLQNHLSLIAPLQMVRGNGGGRT